MASTSRPKCHRLREAPRNPSDGPMGEHAQDELLGPWSWGGGEARHFGLGREVTRPEKCDPMACPHFLRWQLPVVALTSLCPLVTSDNRNPFSHSPEASSPAPESPGRERGARRALFPPEAPGSRRESCPRSFLLRWQLPPQSPLCGHVMSPPARSGMNPPPQILNSVPHTSPHLRKQVQVPGVWTLGLWGPRLCPPLTGLFLQPGSAGGDGELDREWPCRNVSVDALWVLVGRPSLPAPRPGAGRAPWRI